MIDATDSATFNERLVQRITQSINLSFGELSKDEPSPLMKRKVESQLQHLLELASLLCAVHCKADFFSDILVALNLLVKTDTVGEVLRNCAQQVWSI